MNICPLCNGLVDYIKYCPNCAERMQIFDRVENYYDNYSPYLSYDLTDLNDGDPSSICTHVCYCKNCGYQGVVGVKNIVE